MEALAGVQGLQDLLIHVSMQVSADDSKPFTLHTDTMFRVTDVQEEDEEPQP